jgi:hypothetical protein
VISEEVEAVGRLRATEIGGKDGEDDGDENKEEENKEPRREEELVFLLARFAFMISIRIWRRFFCFNANSLQEEVEESESETESNRRLPKHEREDEEEEETLELSSMTTDEDDDEEEKKLSTKPISLSSIAKKMMMGKLSRGEPL